VGSDEGGASQPGDSDGAGHHGEKLFDVRIFTFVVEVLGNLNSTFLEPIFTLSHEE
jgi:hypothetical protein